MVVNPSATQVMTIAGLNLIQQAISIYDSDLKLVLANQRFRDMFKLPDEFNRPGADFGATIRHLAARGDYGDIADLDAFVQDRIDLALAFEPHYIERRFPNGRWISVEGSPLPQGGWVAVYTDITQTRRQEDLLRARSEELSDQLIQHASELSATNRELAATVIALEEAKRQLTESEARTRLTTEMMPAHIAHVGPDRRYTYSNRRLSVVMPGRESNILGLHISDALGEDAFREIRPHLNKAFDGSPSVFEFTDVVSTRRIRVAFTPDSEPTPTRGVYILSMDVTEETQTRAALQQTRRRELAAQMTSGLAHDFSNLLTIILGMQSKLNRMSLDGDARTLVDATLGAARRGGNLLNRIADMTGLRAPKLQPTDMAVFLHDLQTLAGPTLSDRITLTVNNLIPDEHILIDPGMLQDSLLNLILNARDACGGTGGITLIAELVHDTWVRFTVSDTGAGFSNEALKNALAPFFTTKGGEGSGLGLAMVYDMTKLSGGRIALDNIDASSDSGSGTGARVTIQLPLRRQRQMGTPGLVLLVEDNPDLRSAVREMLTELGHTVIEAASVEEAQSLLDSVPDISLVLSDISLEGEATGVDLVCALPVDGIPSYLMTSLPQNHPHHMAGAARAPLIKKPFTAEQLSAFLQPKVMS